MSVVIPKVLQFLILDYLCPLEDPDAIFALENPFNNELKQWTISRQVKIYNSGFEIEQVNIDGDKEHILIDCMVKVSDQLHCVDGPAIVAGSITYWMQFNQGHRIDGPAYENSESGFSVWYYNGKFHRDGGGPAQETKEAKVWYRHGKIHRVDGPAYERLNEKKWYQYGKLHRADGGPAIENLNEKKWYCYGSLHRPDGPSIETKVATQWYWHGKMHRIDGPASESENHKRWYRYGKLHRTDGKPAVEWENGAKRWYRHGKLLKTSIF